MKGEIGMQLGYRDLACEILVQTCLDLLDKRRKGGRNFQNKQDALAFLHTDWFEELCYFLELDPSHTRMKIIQGPDVAKRA